MNIASLDYTFNQRSLDIYLSGCKGPHCEGCHNPLLWDYCIGEDWNIYREKIRDYIFNFDCYIKNIMIFGGEPLDQDIRQLEYMLLFLNSFNKEIWIFTKYNINDVPDNIKKLVSYIKTGRYIKELSPGREEYGILLATSNQKIWKIRDEKRKNSSK